jgi:hypothetical protein
MRTRESSLCFHMPLVKISVFVGIGNVSSILVNSTGNVNSPPNLFKNKKIHHPASLREER